MPGAEAPGCIGQAAVRRLAGVRASSGRGRACPVHRPGRAGSRMVLPRSRAMGEARLAPTARRATHASPLQDGARRAATRSVGTDAPEPPVGAGRARPLPDDARTPASRRTAACPMQPGASAPGILCVARRANGAAYLGARHALTTRVEGGQIAQVRRSRFGVGRSRRCSLLLPNQQGRAPSPAPMSMRSLYADRLSRRR